METQTLRDRLAENLAKCIGSIWNSRNEAGVQTGLGRTTIDEILNKTRNVTLDTVDRIAAKLGVDPIELLAANADAKFDVASDPAGTARVSALLGELPDGQRAAFVESLEQAVATNRAQWAQLARIYGERART